MGAMASQVTNLTVVYSMAYSGADQRKHQRSALLAFVRGSPRTRATNAEIVFIWWRHHVVVQIGSRNAYDLCTVGVWNPLLLRYRNVQGQYWNTTISQR